MEGLRTAFDSLDRDGDGGEWVVGTFSLDVLTYSLSSFVIGCANKFGRNSWR